MKSHVIITRLIFCATLVCIANGCYYKPYDCVYENPAFRLQFERQSGYDHVQWDVAFADVPLPVDLSPKDGKCLVVKITEVIGVSKNGNESGKAIAELKFAFRPFVLGSFYKWTLTA